MIIPLLTLFSFLQPKAYTLSDVPQTKTLKSQEFATAVVHPKSYQTVSENLNEALICFAKGKVPDPSYTTPAEQSVNLQALTEYPIKLGDVKFESLFRGGVNGFISALGSTGCATTILASIPRVSTNGAVKATAVAACGLFITSAFIGEGPLRASIRHFRSHWALSSPDLVSSSAVPKSEFTSSLASIKGISTAVAEAEQISELDGEKIEKCGAVIEKEKEKFISDTFSCTYKQLKGDAVGLAKIYHSQELNSLLPEEKIVELSEDYFIEVHEEVVNSSGSIAHQVKLLELDTDGQLREALDEYFWVDGKFFENASDLPQCVEQKKDFQLEEEGG